MRHISEFMETHIEIEEDIVRRKTLELCEAITRQPQFESIRQRVESFMADASAQEQYQSLSEKGRSLHERQHQGTAAGRRRGGRLRHGAGGVFGEPGGEGLPGRAGGNARGAAGGSSST